MSDDKQHEHDYGSVKHLLMAILSIVIILGIWAFLGNVH